MKKISLLLTAVLLFASTSCNEENVNSEQGPSTNSDSEILSSESLIDSSTEQVSDSEEGFDTSKYQQSKFLDVEEIYLLPEETYELSKNSARSYISFACAFLSSCSSKRLFSSGIVIKKNFASGDISLRRWIIDA